MPEAYTHYRCANIALCFSKTKIHNKTAFVAGANGPDTFFCYRAWSKPSEIDLPALGVQMHNLNCGNFLLNLVENAATYAQKDYALGFLCHYALDTCTHPYIEFLASEGQVYDIAKGHGFYEIALDTALFKTDYGKRAPIYKISSPHLITKALAEVSSQLKQSIATVYQTDIKTDALADSFHHFYHLHRLFYSRFRIRKFFFAIIERLVFKKPGFITCHICPTKFKKNIPDVWQHTITNDTVDGGIKKLLSEGTKLSVTYIKAAENFWAGKISKSDFAKTIGNRSYITGLQL